MQTIKAKMVCNSAVKNAWGAEEVNLLAQYTGSPEDNTYAEATPAGSVLLTISNPEAQGFFVQGQAYYLDFTPAIA